MCQALCYVFSLHYLTESLQPNEVGTRKPDSGMLRNLSMITQQIVAQPGLGMSDSKALLTTWLPEHGILIKSKDLSYSIRSIF